MSLKLSAPQPLEATHLLSDFECGEPALDKWLQRRAMSNQLTGASRSFVVVDEENRVRGFYSMSAGAVSHQLA
ncbi:MAG: GNAT family N-acetyltransferase, partial [Acidithiobacillus sp.]